MSNLIESAVVAETQHLMPNLPIFVKEIFGDNSYYIDWQSSHIDWADDKLKRSDGLIWLPWDSQLWLIEVEWKEEKENSNFFEQSRAFARSKINVKKFKEKLTSCLSHFDEIFDNIRNIRERVIISNIVNKTLEKHIIDDHLCPHIWLLLGHKGDNIKNLREDYLREAKARFYGIQQYIVTTTRMFHNDFLTYFLLEHSFSSDCNNYIKIPKSTLIAGKTNISSAISDNASPIISSLETTIQSNKPQKGETFPPYQNVTNEGQAYKLFTYLSKVYPEFKIKNTRLRLKNFDNSHHDFKIAWDHSGPELCTIDKYGIRNKPGIAAKKIFGAKIPPNARDIAYTIGSIIDISETPAKIIVSYKDATLAIRRGLEHIDYELSTEQNIPQTENELDFSDLDSKKIEAITKQVIGRKKLWEKFVQQLEMTSEEFKQFSEFKPKAVANFIKFLNTYKLAKRTNWYSFTLENNAIPLIQKILKEN